MKRILAILILLTLVFPTMAQAAPMPATSQPAIAAVATTAGVKIIQFTKEVRRGGNASLKIQTAPGSKCSLSYRTPAGTASTARGLGAKVADKKGVCLWKWKISPSTRPGTGTLTLTVNGVARTYPIKIK